MSIGGDCPEDTEGTTAAASAVVPLKEGLTLSYAWTPNSADHEYECLVQVNAITSSHLDITQSCPVGNRTVVGQRRICRVDLRNAYFYLSETSPHVPPVIAGTTMFSLSSQSFRELKGSGKTRHRYVEIADDWRTSPPLFGKDSDATLYSGRFDHEQYSVIVNNRAVEFPVLRSLASPGKHWQTIAKVLDDERFPLVLEYEVPEEGFHIHYNKISYPTGGELEKELAAEKHIDVYGIYFDFGSDALRPESNPVLREIADTVAKNASWTLEIHGHTDNVGGNESNMELSRRRAAAVKNALVERYAIKSERLSIAGHGASQPKASNETPDGRAKNRRVELVRQ